MIAHHARNLALRAALSAAILGLSACHSHHIDITIENRTGAGIRLVEVDYPSAGFGADSVASGADFHYRVQVRGSGPLTLRYSAGNRPKVLVAGPTLVEEQQGQLSIVLLPGDKAEFHSDLTPPS